MSLQFIGYTPKPEDYWRGIILFGRNVASYKFALAQALLDIQPDAGRLIRLEELAVPYTSHLRAHLRLANKQGTFQKSRFLDACRMADAGELTDDQLVEQTVRLGFNYVIDAFHVVGQDATPTPFFVDERQSGGIRITDTFAELLNSIQAINLSSEVQARWRLVETAWKLGMSKNLLVRIEHDSTTENLFYEDTSRMRRSITGAREALNGYQKGHCFFCFSNISILGAEPPDVDHFFPHRLKALGLGGIIDGVWNLVLSCRACNRGPAGKFDRVPTLKLLQRLHKRNEFLIASHHPLRETLIAQAGASETDRQAFLNTIYRQARAALIHEWEPLEVREPLF